MLVPNILELFRDNESEMNNEFRNDNESDSE